MAGKDFGGRITIRLSTGALMSLRGNFSIMPAGRSNEAVVNQDGSVSRVQTLAAYGFEITFEDKGIDYTALMSASRFNVTAVEDFTGVTHYWTDGFIVGTPSVNRMNGEVTGLSGASEAYSRTGA
jgi:hypothetical protein